MSQGKSLYSIESFKEKKYDTIPFRIDFITDLLKDKKLNVMVDFNDPQTEQFVNPNNFRNTLINKVTDINKNDEDTLEDLHKNKSNADSNANQYEDLHSYDTTTVLDKQLHNFYEIINQIGGKLLYVKSGTTGHTFKGIISKDGDKLNYAVKVVAYPKKEKYGDILDVRRPENAEIMMIRTLSYFVIKKQTPHIVLPIGTFNTAITPFISLINDNVVDKDNKKYKEFIDKYNDDYYADQVSILISEWANRGDLLDFIRKNYKEFTAVHWKVFFFQVISVLAVIQNKFPGFRHNDLKANNVLVHKIKQRGTMFSYTVNRCRYVVPSIGYQVKLWDFDFACIPGIVDNKKVTADWTDQINVKPVQNRYYDMHYFFNTLIKKGFFPQFMEEDCIPKEAKEFVNRIVPPKFQAGKYVSKRGRIMFNNEFLIPDDVLKRDPYFEEFRNSKIKTRSRSDSQKKSVKRPSKKPDKQSTTHDNKVRKSSDVSNLDKLLFEDYKRDIMKKDTKKRYQLTN